MKSYPLGGSPPDTPGIYALKNRVTNHIYIGKAISLRRRYQEWRGVISSGLGYKNFLLRAAATASPEDWEFQIVLELPDTAADQLDALEQRAIQKAVDASPDLVLNVMRPTGRVGSRTAKSAIFDEEGQQITQGEAARRLGTSLKQLQKRVARRRLRGQCTITLTEMRLSADLYKQQIGKINLPQEARLH